ncbi:unnamed protein product [Urochloa decumbens]|uniref:Protein kinase domain-containing protein n=1 Tax=Urochloa decumbens TaxID=240449 RepID=A0ABC9BGS9_9POAL
MWSGLGNAATVAQLVGVDAGGIISMIQLAARTAGQNKKDCEHLAGRVEHLAELIPCLPQDRESQRGLTRLHGTLLEAHDLIMSCQGRGLANQLWNASRQAERFRDIERKIDACLSSFILISHIGIIRRLDGDNSSQRQHEDVEEFTRAEIMVATDNFYVVLSDDDNGFGGTATVYKGTLGNGQDVDVKRLNPEWRGAEDAFATELAILSPLRHEHIVRLLGRCADGGERIVVTQHMANGSLYNQLHGLCGATSSSPVASSWKARVQALLGAARAVEHLHRRAVPLVIHGGVTSSNILLDDTWTSRLAGFGAAVRQEAGVESQSQAVAPVAAADTGCGYAQERSFATAYADPEHCSTGRIKPASDVYSLGVVMLEVLTGNLPVNHVWDEGSQTVVPNMTLASFVLPRIRGGRLGDVLDTRPALQQQTSSQQQLGPPTPLQMVADTAARCLLLHGDNRPAIADVVANLERALQLLCGHGNL